MRMIFVVLIAILSSSCGKLPTKPEVENCIIINSTGGAYCYNNQTSEETFILLEEMNKYTCFSPEDWGETLLYIRRLEQAVPSKIKKELIKLRESHLKNLDRIKKDGF